LKEAAQCWGRRSSGSRSCESLGFAARSDSTFDAGGDVSVVRERREGMEGKRTLAFATGFVDGVFGFVVLHGGGC
jgi:hypothetical protein